MPDRRAAGLLTGHDLDDSGPPAWRAGLSAGQALRALVFVGAFLGLLWLLQVVNWADSYHLDRFGILPHHVSHLADIFTAPLLHFSWPHLEGNSIPFLVVAVTSGLAVWLFQSSTELTVGASGLIFGYFGYVLVRGIFDRNLVDVG